MLYLGISWCVALWLSHLLLYCNNMHKSHLYFSYLHQHDFRELLFSLQKSPTKSSSPTSRIKQMFFFQKQHLYQTNLPKSDLVFKIYKNIITSPIEKGASHCHPFNGLENLTIYIYIFLNPLPPLKEEVLSMVTVSNIYIFKKIPYHLSGTRRCLGWLLCLFFL
jgi:hypothetical protein